MPFFKGFSYFPCRGNSYPFFYVLKQASNVTFFIFTEDAKKHCQSSA